MNKSLKRRIYTSLLLIGSLFLMFINNFILGYFLIIFGTFSILEFLKMN